MNSSVFVDTSAFYAVLDRDDDNHRKAAGAWADIIGQNYGLVTSNYILLETLALLQSRIGIEAVRVLQNDVVPIVRVEFVTPELHAIGVAALLAASKRRLSLVDCISFEIVRSLGLEAVFAFDAHFRAYGFRMMP
jgi:predicted nucleic acid-binding protein